MNRVCLIGAGHISRTHAEALGLTPTAEAVAVCDTDADRARRLAEQYGLAHAFGSLEEAVASETFDSAHVLLPPDLHGSTARRLLAAGIGVFLEKPMGLSSEECASVCALAQRQDVPLGVNHNALFYPAYLELRRSVRERVHGPLQHLIVVWNLPRQALPQPDSWVLADPWNLAFETAVHPLSQVYDLAGELVSADTTFSDAQTIGGAPFFATWMMSLECEDATAQVCVSYAGSQPMWQLTAICEDGVVTVEVEQNRVTALGKTRWGRYAAPVHTALTVGTQEAKRAVRTAAHELAASRLPDGPVGPWFGTMRDSIAAFHGRPDAGQPHVDGLFGSRVVAMCEASAAGMTAEAPRVLRRRRPRHLQPCDVLVTGGTGFIGSRVVEQLVAGGASVRVLARHLTGLKELFDDDTVHLIQGDVADAGTVSQATRGVRAVAHLATGDISSFDAAESSIVRATDDIAQACLREDVERLVFSGTIASLYLGDPRETITGNTPLDQRVRERGAYQWAKARAEQVLLGYLGRQGLPICIVRPGIVLGAGGTPFHSGFGIWRGGVHCVGWNSGTNPLPLVLASDVARAIVQALTCDRAIGKTYNLVGDVRMSARECVDELRDALHRPLVFHPVHPAQHQALQLSKWAAKAAVRRTLPELPSYRAIKSSGCVAQFDCSEVKSDLDWTPTADPARFSALALRVHSRQPRRRAGVQLPAAQSA